METQHEQDTEMAYGRYTRSRRAAPRARGYSRASSQRRPVGRTVRGAGSGKRTTRGRSSGVTTIKLVLQQAPVQGVSAPVEPFNALKVDGQAKRSKY